MRYLIVYSGSMTQRQEIICDMLEKSGATVIKMPIENSEITGIDIKMAYIDDLEYTVA